MLEVTEEARKELARLAGESDEGRSFRINYWACGCGAPTMGIGAESPRKGDRVFDEGEFSVAVGEDVWSQLRGIRVHFRPNKYVGTEFLVTPL